MKKYPTFNIKDCRSDWRGHKVNNIGYKILTSFGFTPCKAAVWLLEPKKDAAELAAKCAAILLSPARSSIDGFQKARKCGEKLYRRAESISWGEHCAGPNMNGEMTGNSNQKMNGSGKRLIFASCFFEGKARGEQPNKFNLITERTPTAPRQ